MPKLSTKEIEKYPKAQDKGYDHILFLGGKQTPMKLFASHEFSTFDELMATIGTQLAMVVVDNTIALMGPVTVPDSTILVVMSTGYIDDSGSGGNGRLILKGTVYVAGSWNSATTDISGGSFILPTIPQQSGPNYYLPDSISGVKDNYTAGEVTTPADIAAAINAMASNLNKLLTFHGGGW